MEKQIEDKINGICALIKEYERLIKINNKKINSCYDNELMFAMERRILDKYYDHDDYSLDETSSDEEDFVKKVY